jgi:hypothetical protein
MHGETVKIKVFYLPSILTDYFNNYNFSKAQIIRSLMMVIKPKHVGAVLK